MGGKSRKNKTKRPRTKTRRKIRRKIRGGAQGRVENNAGRIAQLESQREQKKIEIARIIDEHQDWLDPEADPEGNIMKQLTDLMMEDLELEGQILLLQQQ